MKKYLTADGLIWVLLGAWLCIASMRLKLGDFHTPGAGFLPFIAGALLVIFGLILMSSTVLSQKRDGEEARNQKGIVTSHWRSFVNPLLTVVILFGYILLLEPLGFLLTTFVCLVLLFKLSEPRRWVTPVVLSGVTAILSYLIFAVWLQCQLPKGLLRFW